MGKISRLSRRVAAGPLVTRRVMTRALMQHRRHFDRIRLSEASASSQRRGR